MRDKKTEKLIKDMHHYISGPLIDRVNFICQPYEPYDYSDFYSIDFTDDGVEVRMRLYCDETVTHFLSIDELCKSEEDIIDERTKIEAERIKKNKEAYKKRKETQAKNKIKKEKQKKIDDLKLLQELKDLYEHNRLPTHTEVYR